MGCECLGSQACSAHRRTLFSCFHSFSLFSASSLPLAYCGCTCTQEGVASGFVASEGWVQGGAGVQLVLIPAVVSMGSADHRLNLAEILSQNYGVREEREEEDDAQEKQKSLEELEKSFSASQVKAAREGKGKLPDGFSCFSLTVLAPKIPVGNCFACSVLCLSPPTNRS